MELRHDEVGPIVDHLVIARHGHERLEGVAIQTVGPLRLRDPGQVQHTAATSMCQIVW